MSTQSTGITFLTLLVAALAVVPVPLNNLAFSAVSILFRYVLPLGLSRATALLPGFARQKTAPIG